MTYTPIDFDALQAGRTLDALVAEKIFGWRWEGVVLTPPRTPAPVSFYPQHDLFDGRYHIGHLPNYSEDMGAAFGLVEHFKAQWLQRHGADDHEPWVWELKDCQAFGWRADIVWLHHDGDIDVTGSKADTLPLAITLTALRIWEEYEGRFEGQEPPDVSEVTPGNSTPF